MVCALMAQNTTILFLRDGSIIQGTITHENPNKIFLKTDMGFVQIKPEDIIGREDLAKKGDLTYMSDQIEFVRRHVENLSGKTVSWKDSLQNNINNLYVTNSVKATKECGFQSTKNSYKLMRLLRFIISVESVKN